MVFENHLRVLSEMPSGFEMEVHVREYCEGILRGLLRPDLLPARRIGRRSGGEWDVSSCRGPGRGETSRGTGQPRRVTVLFNEGTHPALGDRKPGYPADS